MKVQFADEIIFSLCDMCHSVHIEMVRDGKVFAVAIPDDANEVARELAEKIAESKARQRTAGHKH